MMIMNCNCHQRKHCYLSVLFFITVFNLSGSRMQAQDTESLIRSKDSLFWIAYNRCDIDGMRQYLSEDLEFYHDKGGIIRSVDELMTATKNNLCSRADFRLRREAVKNSVQFFPMQQSGTLYGAILSGQHLFYIIDGEGEERLDGLARFTHLWLLKNGSWKMSRILSFDHGPAIGNR